MSDQKHILQTSHKFIRDFDYTYSTLNIYDNAYDLFKTFFLSENKDILGHIYCPKINLQQIILDWNCHKLYGHLSKVCSLRSICSSKERVNVCLAWQPWGKNFLAVFFLLLTKTITASARRTAHWMQKYKDENDVIQRKVQDLPNWQLKNSAFNSSSLLHIFHFQCITICVRNSTE